MTRVLDAAADLLPAVWVGADRRLAVLRALESDDDGLIDEFVRELSPASRHDRFHVGVTALPAPWLHALTRVDPAHEFALLALASAGGRAVCIAEARYALDPGRDDAREFALVVADGWHGQGLGAELLRRLVAHARGRGIERLYGDVLRTNDAMVRLATRAGFRVATHPEDRRLLRVTRGLEPAEASVAAVAMAGAARHGVAAARLPG
ncbi:MAG TPA: GNAT family N-acetyltransferase [Burkholderiaceae bacterium]|nr:GNAT family N-acetyltransferase [Burkholderiaceae bacterium]